MKREKGGTWIMADIERLHNIIGFLETIDQFKTCYRAAYLTNSDRHENDAEHTWHMAMFALLLHQELSTPVDLEHTLKLILTHDLVEIYAGDTFAHDAEGHRDKQAREEAAAHTLFSRVPEDIGEELYQWWREFEEGQTPEAQFARAMDRLQAFAQNIFARGRLWQERQVSETTSRAYNEPVMQFDPAIASAYELLYRRARAERLWPEIE